MIEFRASVILPGQLYYHVEENQYIVVTRNTQGRIRYEGEHGLMGIIDAERLVAWHPPVNPGDLEPAELATLQACLAEALRIGYIPDDDLDIELQYEFDEEVAA